MGYKVTVGGKTYNIKVPSWLSTSKEKLTTQTPVSVGHGVAAKRDRKSQLEDVERQLQNVGKSRMEQEVFDNDYTDK